MRFRSPVVTVIIILNSLVFAMWLFFGDAEPANFMYRNFLVSAAALREGRWWVLLTSVFSHNMFLHLFINMLVLNSFGRVLEALMGSRRFLRFYLIAGVVGSLGHVSVSEWLLASPDLPALGASGAISGLVVLFSMIFPREKILLLGLIPLPAVFGVFVFIGLDLWGLVAQVKGGGLPIGHGAHLGGALAGFVWYILRHKVAPIRRPSR